MAALLTAADVKRLLDDPSADNRRSAIQGIAAGFNKGELSASERGIAEDIFRIMAKDAEVRVREALTANLCRSAALPGDIAQALAKDSSDSVALPVIQFSEVLSEDDLIDIVRTQSGDRQVAVANRETVSVAVSDSLVESGNEEAVVALVSNKGAELDEAVMHKVVDKYGDVEAVQEPLVQRPRLPVAVSERLVARVSDKLKEYLVTHHELPPDLASDLVMQSRERATLGLVSDGGHNVWELVQHLHDNKRLTPSIMLRALCLGDLSFFEAAISVRSGTIMKNTRQLLFDAGSRGMRAIYDKAGLPETLYPAFRAAFDVTRQSLAERSDMAPDAMAKRTLERVLTHFEDLVDEDNIDDVDYLLGKLNQLSDSAEHRTA
ncbi:MAG: DUF2336 domain-containing protein [Rhodospirillaceae bacterium]|jgi:uncharacterized protein (DUF2336 family)|nr:DUF2336 domain-containing protein [Rhodospirillaceae bacterium]MBT5663755.1 DUF2336 domain-containing protein [Rhodospirillaceae bacterium]MBT5809900.1 DUF2336 domain-containing protein [Rhodospirillaceae bacterium]